jgi:hypothetical protein
MRVMGRAQGTLGVSAYDVYLLQVDGGFAYLASVTGGTLVIRSALTGEVLDSPQLTRKAREAVGLTAANAGDGQGCDRLCPGTQKDARVTPGQA